MKNKADELYSTGETTDDVAITAKQDSLEITKFGAKFAKHVQTMKQTPGNYFYKTLEKGLSFLDREIRDENGQTVLEIEENHSGIHVCFTNPEVTTGIQCITLRNTSYVYPEHDVFTIAFLVELPFSIGTHIVLHYEDDSKKDGVVSQLSVDNFSTGKNFTIKLDPEQSRQEFTLHSEVDANGTLLTFTTTINSDSANASITYTTAEGESVTLPVFSNLPVRNVTVGLLHDWMKRTFPEILKQ